MNLHENNELLVRVANDDMLSFESENEWLRNHPGQAIIFKESNSVWDKLKTTYFSIFSKLVYGELPTEAEILKTLKIVSKRLAKVDWKIE